jgi:uncharacterized protein YpuA (DUF1002 family)
MPIKAFIQSNKNKLKKMNNLEVKKAKEILKKNGYLNIYWHKQDIINVAEDNDIELTETQVNKIAKNIENLESNYGIDYNTIENEINNVVPFN